MRADRLISMLMLLQSHGRLTADQLASELEVSVRTIHRDVIALSTAGIPVYCERGPGGGISLMESYRTTLTGLNPDEVQALFMVSLPAPLLQLGVGQEFQSAMRKLSAALPESKRREGAQARQRIHLDSAWWFQADATAPCLPALHQAAWTDRLVRMRFRATFGAEVEQVVAPYGLVAKAALWHLVYAWQDNVRVLRLSQVIAVEVLAETFERPAGFHLAAFWEAWCREYELERTLFTAVVCLRSEHLRSLGAALGLKAALLEGASPSDQTGRVRLELPFDSLETARAALLGLGRMVEVLEPLALRRSLLDYARQVVGLYEPGG